MMHLSELGERICILGPSNSGKSTLADAIARRSGSKAIHLDQLHHLPNTNWVPRPAKEFVALHDEAITGERWVIDGNYSKLFPQRFQRATGVILLDISTLTSLFRYLRRTIFERSRIGALAGGQDSIKLAMLHHIAVVTPGNRKRYAEVYRQLVLPKLYLPSTRDLNKCYQEWGLERTPRHADDSTS
ncbi:AAA family ATPase [Terriglobus roseus]|uniref:Adenylate kinase n=1 Tax=Terriglobus roseus TaxID=392734 RepID=A0A1G7PUJ4_9BACT|nr:AAA family ATPase [Terriglobus roseus]SDF89883.1 Adenylate kinase [Terriglobus roseus]